MNRRLTRLAVYCGSSSGHSPAFEREAFAFGKLLAERGVGVVYGGAQIGLMGAVANGALSVGGQVIGVLPRFLHQVEIAHNQLTELVLVDTMHERKQKMEELCEGAVALPGGFGTLEELFEMLTWGQLSLHRKPVALLNWDGYYDSLLAQIQHMAAQGFVKTQHQGMLLAEADAVRLLHRMQSYQPVVEGKLAISRDRM